MPITEILSEDQRRKRVWRRVQYLVVFVCLAVIALVMSFEYRSGRMDTNQRWIENYGERLIDNYEPLLIQALKNSESQDQTVTLAIETLRNQPVVIEASLFDASGVPVLKQMDVTAAQLLNHYGSSSPQIFVRELYDVSDTSEKSHQQLGYLRMTMDREFIVKQNAGISQSKLPLLVLVSVIALIFGIAIGGRFTKWRFKI